LFFTRKSLSAVSGPKAGTSVARGASGSEPIKLRTMEKMGSLRAGYHRRQLAARDRRADARGRAEAQVRGRFGCRVQRRGFDDGRQIVATVSRQLCKRRLHDLGRALRIVAALLQQLGALRIVAALLRQLGRRRPRVLRHG
jgi:hypothetical protein